MWPAAAPIPAPAAAPPAVPVCIACGRAGRNLFTKGQEVMKRNLCPGLIKYYP